MNIVILAAGKGTRMKSDLPKVLHPIGGQPMLAHVLATAAQLAPHRMIVVAGHGAARVQAEISEFFSSANPAASVAALDPSGLHWALQDPPLGTGHAVQQAVPYLDPAHPTLILYGDVPLITTQTLSRLLTASAPSGFALLTADLSVPQGYGRIVRNETGQITRIVEEKDATDSERLISEINTGTMVCETSQLLRWLAQLTNHNAQHEFYLTDIISMASQAGVSIGSAQPDREEEILGVNSQAQRAELERVFQRQQAELAMSQGVALADPRRFDVRGVLVCGNDVSIDVGCVFQGRVEIASGASIGPYCVITNAQIEAGARIEAFSHIEGARIGPSAVVGPYARLRPGADLDEGVHVGNFVEIKNSTLGKGSKANHLSYLGDATIGAKVNVGAGTITCNYDGADKHRTVIEDNAFIGSGTELVAPVVVGAGATLGAGTTLTQDAPAHQLTVSRSPQVSIARWKRPQKKAH